MDTPEYITHLIPNLLLNTIIWFTYNNVINIYKQAYNDVTSSFIKLNILHTLHKFKILINVYSVKNSKASLFFFVCYCYPSKCSDVPNYQSCALARVKVSPYAIYTLFSIIKTYTILLLLLVDLCFCCYNHVSYFIFQGLMHLFIGFVFITFYC